MGELLFDGNCVTCHQPNKSISAPSMRIIQENYLRAFPKKQDFINYMSQWVLKPNEETSLMLPAIKEYKLMPELGYDESTLKDISAYIYDTQF